MFIVLIVNTILGVWVVGGVEKTEERKCFMIVVENRSSTTLMTIIKKFVLPGSIVRTDCWAGYRRMTSLGMNLVHQTVNHSVTFRDGDVHTNTIEGKNINFILIFHLILKVPLIKLTLFLIKQVRGTA